MNNLVPDFLTANEKTMIAEDIDAATADSQISESITYSALGTSSYNAASGVMDRNDTDSTINAIKGAISTKEIADSNGLLSIGDIRWLIDRADLTTTPTIGDRITYGSDIYEVVAYEAGQLDKHWRITTRLT